MLNSVEAVLEKGFLTFLEDIKVEDKQNVIVTFLGNLHTRNQVSPEHIANREKLFGMFNGVVKIPDNFNDSHDLNEFNIT